MEPRIQYAKTEDGVSIAYWTMGEGRTPLVLSPSTTFSPTKGSSRTPEVGQWYESLASSRMLIRFDHRGAGLSQDVAYGSLEDRVQDLDAVVNDQGLEKIALFGRGGAGPLAIAYAALHPEQVSHLLLFCTSAKAPVLPPTWEALVNLAELDPKLAARTMAREIVGWEQGISAEVLEELLEESLKRETGRANFEEWIRSDATKYLGDVKSQTLVMHRRSVGEDGPVVAGHLDLPP